MKTPLATPVTPVKAFAAALLAGIESLLGAICASLLASLLVIVLTAVVLRYGFHTGFFGSEELASWLYVALIAFGAPLAINSALAMRLDLLTARLSPSGQRITAIIADMFTIMSGLILSFGSAKIATLLGGISPTLGLPEWIRFGFLGLGGFFILVVLALQRISESKWPDLKEKLKAQNFIATGFINYGARHLLTKEPVTKPEQLQGKRIRVIQSPLHTKLWGNLGATPIGIPITETYNALETGVADAMDLTKSAYASFKLYEVVPYVTETSHIWASGVVYFSAGFWNGLNAEQQQVLLEASMQATAYFNQLIVEDETAAIAKATEHNAQVLQPEDYDKWQEGAKVVWEEFAPVVGGIDRINAIKNL